ncbi:helix-turn-helix domain-containing protein [Streptomyces niveus]
MPLAPAHRQSWRGSAPSEWTWQPPSASIRRRRLERCHADLANPALRHRTIGETATRWGFRHPADFSRAFRGVYGASPSEVRARALDAKDACASG